MKSKNHLIGLILSAFIPIAIFLVVFMGPNITQGRYTLLVSDLNGQYVNYFLYFKEAILRGDNLFYSFSMLLGGDTFSLIGYYLLSPLNIILLLWPSSSIASGIFTVIAIKVGLSGLTSYLYFSRKRENAFYPLIFSTTYALGGYIFAYFMHVMWLDALYLLPLVILGLELLVEKKNKTLYIISLALAIVSCYYTGYMIAGFSLVYFIYLQIRDRQSAKDRFKTIFTFSWTSILAAAMSAVTLFPTLLSQMGNRQAQTTVNNGILHSAADIFAKFFTGVFNDVEFSEGAPQIYCGIFILFLLVLFFISIRENTRQVIAGAFLLATLFACFSIGILDRVWHGMAMPNNFTHRYAFVFIFSCVVLAEECFSNRKLSITLPKLIISDIIIAALAAWIFSSKPGEMSIILLAIDMAALIAISGLFYLYRKNTLNNRLYMLMLLLFIQGAQLLLNGKVYTELHNYDDHSTEGFYSATKPIVEEVQNMDDGFYRLEKTYHNSQNDAMMLSFNGLSHFSSADKSYIRGFMGNLGYNKSYDFWAYYDKGATPAADSLLGVKYILSKEPVTYYDETAAIASQRLYKNPSALEIGTVCSDQIKNLMLTADAPFENQEMIFSAMLGTETDMFIAYEEPELGLVNLTASDNSYGKIDVLSDGIILFSFTAKDSNPIYMYLPCVYNPGLQVAVNGEDKGEYLVTYHRGIFELGSFEEGEQVSVELYLHGTHAVFENIQLYGLDTDKLEETAISLQEQGWTVNEYNSGRVNATFTVEQENSVLFITIPYNKNWKITVDGNAASAHEVLDALIAVEVEPGTHTIKMHYEPAGLSLGCIVSALSLTCFILLALIEIKRAKKVAAASKQQEAEPQPEASESETSKSETAKAHSETDEAKENGETPKAAKLSLVEYISTNMKITKTQIVSYITESLNDKKETFIKIFTTKPSFKLFDKQKAAERSLKKFLFTQYKGHCQICSKQITDKDDNFVWYPYSLFKAGEDSDKTSLPAAWDKICVCFTCKANLQYGDVSMKQLLSDAVATKPDKSEKKIKFKIRMQNEPANITYSTRHLKHLQQALDGETGKARMRTFRYNK